MNRYEELVDYRRAVAYMYARVRESSLDPQAQCQEFRHARDALFRTHPQSALTAEQKARFGGLPYCAYEASLRFVTPLDTEVAQDILEVELREEGLLRLRRVGKVHVTIATQPISLSLFWIDTYGGGLFLPFRDATNGEQTYEGGRYLLDTIKGADLGQTDAGVIIDFNYAYNPSCAYNPRWDCPLAPLENHLTLGIEAGEKRYDG